MSEEIRKKIEEKIDKRFVLTGGIAAAIFKEAAEFGYQLGYEEAMKEIAKHPLAHLLLFDPMASESKEPKP